MKTKNILITGASSGFGRAAALRFAANGWQVFGMARRAERLAELQNVTPVVCDITNQSAMEAALSNLPTLDVLVNNAGLAQGQEPAYQSKLEDWDTMIATNITALTHLTRMVLPGMVTRGHGHIINIGSTAGHYAYPGGNVYAATKAFVEHFTRNLRSDLVGTGVRATCVAPGMAETEFSQVRFKGDNTKAAAVYKGMQALTADDLAEAIYWVANQPQHVNINYLELMPTAQAIGPFAVHRQS